MLFAFLPFVKRLNANIKTPSADLRRGGHDNLRLICKPSSVVYGYLSNLTVACKFKRYLRLSADGQPLHLSKPIAQSCIGWGLIGSPCCQGDGELLPRHSNLTAKTAVYFCSLSLKSPSPAVNRHPCPAMLGLSSRYFRSPQPYN